MLDRNDVKRHFGWTKNFKKQPTEEERIKKLKEVIEQTEKQLQMYKDMLKEKDLY